MVKYIKKNVTQLAMASLSLCMITKDEADSLKICLESCKSFVDEIIVIDTGSSDNTMGIAKEFTSNVFHFAWCDDFSKARNESLRHATKDWVIYLDADEIISSEDWKNIRSIINSNAADAYLMHQRNYTNDKTSLGWTPRDSYQEARGEGFFVSPIIRLFRNKKEYAFSYRVHEAVDHSILANKGIIKNSRIPIHHYGYLKSQEVIAKKREDYLKLGLAQAKETPENPRPYYEVGMIYKNTGKYEEAKKCFEKVAELNPKYKLVLTNLGDIYAKSGETTRAIEAYKQSIAEKNDENAYINFGMLCYKIGKSEDAIKLLKKAVELNPKNPIAYNNLGLLLTKTKKYREALAVFEVALKETSLPKFQRVIEVIAKKFEAPLKILRLYKEKKYDELQHYLEERIKKNPNDAIAYAHLGKLFMSTDRGKMAVSLLQGAVKKNKSASPEWINLYVNLANLFIEGKKFAKAEGVVKEALSLDARNEFLQKKLAFIRQHL